jgi:hypothetical protein
VQDLAFQQKMAAGAIAFNDPAPAAHAVIRVLKRLESGQPKTENANLFG